MKSDSFTFSCPACGQHIAASQADAGANANCPSCNAELVVPDKTGTEALSHQKIHRSGRNPLLIPLVTIFTLIAITVAALVFHMSSDDSAVIQKSLIGIWNATDGSGHLLSFDEEWRISLDAVAVAPGRAAGDEAKEGTVLAREYELRGKVKYRIIQDKDVERMAGKEAPAIQFAKGKEEYMTRWLIIKTTDDELELLDGRRGEIVPFKRISKNAFKITNETEPDEGSMIWLKVGPGTPFNKDDLKWSSTM